MLSQLEKSLLQMLMTCPQAFPESAVGGRDCATLRGMGNLVNHRSYGLWEVTRSGVEAMGQSWEAYTKATQADYKKRLAKYG